MVSPNRCRISQALGGTALRRRWAAQRLQPWVDGAGDPSKQATAVWHGGNESITGLLLGRSIASLRWRALFSYKQGASRDHPPLRLPRSWRTWFGAGRGHRDRQILAVLPRLFGCDFAASGPRKTNSGSERASLAASRPTAQVLLITVSTRFTVKYLCCARLTAAFKILVRRATWRGGMRSLLLVFRPSVRPTWAILSPLGHSLGGIAEYLPPCPTPLAC